MTSSMIQFDLSPIVAPLNSDFHNLSCLPATADIIIEVIKVDEIDKGYSRYVASSKLIQLNDLLDDTTSLLSTNQSSWFCLGRQAGRPEIAMYGGRLHNLKNSECVPAVQWVHLFVSTQHTDKTYGTELYC